MAKKMPPEQRALFTFLIATLVGPALAAVAVLVVSAVSALLGRPGTPVDADIAQRLAWSAGRALSAYVWSALPAGLAGGALALLVWRNGGFPWIAAAIAGAVAATLLFVLGGGRGGETTAVAFLGASVGVAIWALAGRLRLIKT